MPPARAVPGRRGPGPAAAPARRAGADPTRPGRRAPGARRLQAGRARPRPLRAQRVGAQWRQALQSDPRMAADPVERRSGLTARVGSAGHDHRGRQLVEPVEDVEHELERCRVAAVQIVDRQQRGARLGRAGHDREQAVRQGEVTRVAWLGQVLAGAGQRAHPVGCLIQEGPALLARKVGHEGSDELAGDTEGQVLLELGARGAQHPHTAASALVERRLMQTSLAHSAVPLEQERGAVAGGDRIERIGDRLERRLSLLVSYAPSHDSDEPAPHEGGTEICVPPTLAIRSWGNACLAGYRVVRGGASSWGRTGG